jgi:pimeloyl-ACP methyl ester carboxylesterase
MTTKSKPTILLVPGAWMPSDCFYFLRYLLTQEGFESVTVDHPSVGSEPADQTLDNDVANLRNTLDRLIEQEGKYVLLLLHSYGTFKKDCV